MSFPTDEALFFMLCDDFRHADDGKLSIFGVLGDKVQVKQPLTQKLVALRSLGMCLFFRDGLGKFQMSMGLTAPGNKVMLPMGTKQQVEKKSDGWMNVALKFEPFSGESGDYILNISLTDGDGKEKVYKKSFSINIQPEVTLQPGVTKH
jgi:hypothetical protein